ncbi:MAG TPA: pyruvate synthase subunit beta [Methanosarcinales archaeon]|nr:pyruvate synthase subunit beta [Methanosarcinales archaeon]
MEDYLVGGHVACQGCSASLGLRLALKVLGKDTIVINGSGCMTLLPVYPNTPLKVPWIHLAIENTGAAGTALYYALRRKNIKANILGYAGDGATYDIGIQSLSGAAEKNIDMIYICYNNQSFGNTGHQRASSTPRASYTTTTPFGKVETAKDMPSIMAAHRIPYIATACPSFPIDFLNKVEKAAEVAGMAFIDLLVPCPVGWGFDPADGIDIGRLAVRTGMWKLYEIVDGRLNLTYIPEKRRKVSEYLRAQARFSHLSDEDIEKIQAEVDCEWEELEERGYGYELGIFVNKRHPNM